MRPILRLVTSCTLPCLAFFRIDRHSRSAVTAVSLRRSLRVLYSDFGTLSTLLLFGAFLLWNTPALPPGKRGSSFPLRQMHSTPAREAHPDVYQSRQRLQTSYTAPCWIPYSRAELSRFLHLNVFPASVRRKHCAGRVVSQNSCDTLRGDMHLAARLYLPQQTMPNHFRDDFFEHTEIICGGLTRHKLSLLLHQKSSKSVKSQFFNKSQVHNNCKHNPAFRITL